MDGLEQEQARIGERNFKRLYRGLIVAGLLLVAVAGLCLTLRWF